MGFRKGMAAFGGGSFLHFSFLISWPMRISKTTKQTIHHVLSYFITCNQEEIPNLTETGGSKYGVPQGYGCIWRRYPFYKQFLFRHFLVVFHHVSSKSSSQEEIPNLTETGGSKYGVPQGYGCIWRRYPFYIFVLSFLGLCGYQRPRNKQFIMSYHISSRLI